MDIKKFLNIVCQEIKYEPAKDGIAEELKLHIQEIKEDYMNNGMQEQEAEEKAVSQMGVAKDIGKSLNKIHRPKLDWKLLILIVLLMGFGIVVSILKQPTMNDNYIGSTIIYMAIGVLLGISIYFFDYKKLKKYSNVIYLIVSFIMIFPMITNYRLINGLLYIRIFNITIFPPTIAVPLYLMAFIGFITNYDRNRGVKIVVGNKEISINKDLVKILVFSIVSLLLIEYIPSITNAVILGVLYFVIATIKIVQDKENCVKKLIKLYIIPLILISFMVFILLIESPFRFERIISSFIPESDPEGSGYIGMLQKEILENSRLIGEANTEVISSNEYIISMESNYTFIYLLGKTGILVAGILVLIIILTSIKLIVNAKKVKEQYGRYLIIGLSALYILQSFATILMNINMGVQTNVNLPFVTYGGVYFIVNILNIAIILSIYRRKDINEYDDKIKKRKITFFKIKENNDINEY